MAGHTKGPWTVDGVGSSFTIRAPGDDGQAVVVAKVDASDSPLDDVQCAANAKVMALSPELLAALQVIVDYQPTPATPPPELVEAERACPDCQSARARQWPPSGLCSTHYSAFSKVWAQNERAQESQHVAMRQIARGALAKAEGR